MADDIHMVRMIPEYTLAFGWTQGLYSVFAFHGIRLGDGYGVVCVGNLVTCLTPYTTLDRSCVVVPGTTVVTHGVDGGGDLAIVHGMEQLYAQI